MVWTSSAWAIQPPDTSWGQLISKGRETLTTAWWLVVFPGAAVFLTTLSINRIAVWLRNNIDLDQRSLAVARTTSRKAAIEFDADEVPEAPHESAYDEAGRDRNIVLEVQDLYVDFFTERGIAKAVRGVTWGVGRGEVLAVVGESGSGKSVTARAIIGILAPQARVLRGAIR